MPKIQSKKEADFLELFALFIRETQRGKRIQKNGRRISPSTIDNYLDLQKLLISFSLNKKFPLRLLSINKLNKKELKSESRYWKNFYKKFTDYLYLDKKQFDNSVGTKVKILRTFFNYLNREKGINTGNLHSHFYAPSEDTPIVVVSPERLNYLIYSNDLDGNLSDRLKKIKDIFIFGCTAALRYSDLINLNSGNLEEFNGKIYLAVQSKKTQTYTKVKLPDYCINILKKYHNKQKTLLPYYSKTYLNKYLKELMEKTNWTEPFTRIRRRRGKPFPVLLRFCDVVSSHTMRRTGITTMLSLGMNDQMVRKISGHAANSKEFYRYVSFTQAYLDKEIDMVHEKLSQKPIKNTLL